MAKLEIPSIVVQNGSSSGSSTTNSAGMEKTNSGKHKSKLSKQAEFDEVDDVDSEPIYDVVGDVAEETKENGSDSDEDQFIDAGGDVVLRSELTDNDKDLANSVKSRTKLCKVRKLGKQGSSQGSATSFEGSCSSLSRESSTEAYTDSTGIDLQQFIIDTLHKNQKDRLMLLKIENELLTFAKESKHSFHKFPQMTSYHRMLVHRCAAFFGMDHNVDQSGTCVIVNKTKSTRLPDFKFKDQIKDELLPHEPRKLILKRDCASFDDKEFRNLDKNFADSKRSKSFEEREEQYEKARARIFNQDLLKKQASKMRPQIVKAHSDCQDFLAIERIRVPVTKASSFCGVASQLGEISSLQISSKPDTLGRNSGIMTIPCTATVLPLQATHPQTSHQEASPTSFSTGVQPPSLQHQLSVQQQQFNNVVSNQTVANHDQQAEGNWKNVAHQSAESCSQTSQGTMAPGQQSVMWAVSSFDSVPPGSVLINPLSGMPYLNPDGSVYRHNPSVAPIIYQTPSGSNLTTDTANVQQQHTQQQPQHVQQPQHQVAPGNQATPTMQQVGQPQQQQSVVYYSQQPPGPQQLLQQHETSNDTELINQFSLMNFGQTQHTSSNQDVGNSERLQHPVPVSTPQNGSSYTYLSQPTQMYYVPSENTNTEPGSMPAVVNNQQVPYGNQQSSVFYPQQPLAMANQPHHVQPVPQPSQAVSGFTFGGHGGNYVQPADMGTIASPSYYSVPSSQANFQHQVGQSSIKGVSPLIGSSHVQYGYTPPMNSQVMPNVSTSRAQTGVVGMNVVGGIQPAVHVQNQNQPARPFTPSAMNFGNMYQATQHNALNPSSISTSPSPHFPSSFANNPFSSFNVMCPNVQMLPARSKPTITPPPSHHILTQMSSSPQLTKSCSFPPMDTRFAGDLTNVESIMNQDYQIMNPAMQQRPRFAPHTMRLIPRQQLVSRIGQQWPQQAAPPTAKNKVRKQRSQTESSGSSNNNSNSSSNASSQSQTPTSIAKNNVLEVQGFPSGMKQVEMDRYLEEIANYGGKLQYLQCDGSKINSAITGSDFVINSTTYKIIAVFESDTASHSALINIKTPKFTLRPSSQNSH